MGGYRREPRRDDARSEVWGVQDRNKYSRRKYRNKGTGTYDGAKKQSEIGERRRDIRGVKRRDINENVFARPTGLRENAGNAISCRGPGPARKRKEIYQ